MRSAAFFLASLALCGAGARADIVGSAAPVAPVALRSPGSWPSVDRVVVRKGEHRLLLMQGDTVLRSYRIALGRNPVGQKERAGDMRTPEGHYLLTRRNPRSEYFLSIQVSYPGPADLRRARAHHWEPGGSIMVHGQPNEPKHSLGYYENEDWTDGCIALSNSDMVEFWMLTPDNVPIDILP